MGEIEKLNSEDFILSEWERKQLDQMVIRNQIEEGREEGRKEGKSLGKEENKKEVAKKMLDDKLDIEIISKYTGLSNDEIKKLK